MNQSLDALVGSMRRALREEILPELASDHARSQLAGVLDVLGKIASMVVWSPDVVREQIDLLDGCLTKAVDRVAAAGLRGPSDLAPGAPQPADTHAALLIALVDAESRFDRLTDWVFSPAAELTTPLRAELHELLRATLRNTLKAQRRLVPSADFSSMTAPRPQSDAQGAST